jgi:hypothetical protein
MFRPPHQPAHPKAPRLPLSHTARAAGLGARALATCRPPPTLSAGRCPAAYRDRVPPLPFACFTAKRRASCTLALAYKSHPPSSRKTRRRRPPLAPPRQTPAFGPYHHHLSSLTSPLGPIVPPSRATCCPIHATPSPEQPLPRPPPPGYAAQALRWRFRPNFDHPRPRGELVVLSHYSPGRPHRRLGGIPPPPPLPQGPNFKALNLCRGDP